MSNLLKDDAPTTADGRLLTPSGYVATGLTWSQVSLVFAALVVIVGAGCNLFARAAELGKPAPAWFSDLDAVGGPLVLVGGLLAFIAVLRITFEVDRAGRDVRDAGYENMGAYCQAMRRPVENITS